MWWFKNSTFGYWNKVGETVYFKYFIYDPHFHRANIISQILDFISSLYKPNESIDT